MDSTPKTPIFYLPERETSRHIFERIHRSAWELELYLRRVLYGGEIRYIVRETYRAGAVLKSRDIIDIGPAPEDFIVYPGGNSFYIDPVVEEALDGNGAFYTADDLEQLFLPFLKPHIRRIIENFDGHRRSTSAWSNCSSDELFEKQRGLHSFDKRRLHYLRFGRIDIGELEGRPWKFLNVLLEKSRDEIEHTIEGMESVLRPREVRSYIYTALHLQSYFPGSLLRNHPVGLDPEKVDERFMEELCRLNVDPLFFRGMEPGGRGELHPLLVKYLILYFDSAFEGGGPLDDYLKEYIRKHRSFRPPSSRPAMAVREACSALCLSVEKFEAMNRGELTRIYRRRAKEAHPDAGGDHDEFVRITEAYEALLERKPG